ncbi:MAG: hypothetical protein KKA81_03290 [Bacteroidetes bacterium]|nr:hypothetical protein [Bacteroidota bacterium]
MKYKNVFWGVILVILGILFILKNMEVIYFRWRDIWSLWPLLLILWGISILPLKSGFKLILSLLAVAVTVWVVAAHSPGWTGYIHHDWEKPDKHMKAWSDQVINEPWDPGVTEVDLKLVAAAGTFILDDTTSGLFQLKHEGNIGPYEMKVSGMESHRKIQLEPESSSINTSRVRNTTELQLNTTPIWNLELDAGAARVELDLRPYRIGKLDIDGGASSVEVSFGDKSEETRVNIDAGVSSLKLIIAESLGCEIRSESFLTSRNFSGLEKVDKGIYQSENFNTSAKKIFINIETAISSITVVRE